MREKTACSRALLATPASSAPLSHKQSLASSLDSVTLVVVDRCAMSNVTDSELLMGRFSSTSRFAQYLTTARLLGARAVASTFIFLL